MPMLDALFISCVLGGVVYIGMMLYAIKMDLDGDDD